MLLTGPWNHGTAQTPCSEEDDSLGLPRPGAPARHAPSVSLVLEGEVAAGNEQELLVNMPGCLAKLVCSKQQGDEPARSEHSGLFRNPTALEQKMKGAPDCGKWCRRSEAQN